MTASAVPHRKPDDMRCDACRKRRPELIWTGVRCFRGCEWSIEPAWLCGRCGTRLGEREHDHDQKCPLRLLGRAELMRRRQRRKALAALQNTTTAEERNAILQSLPLHNKPQYKRPMQDYVKLHREGDEFALSTNATDERVFLSGAAHALHGALAPESSMQEFTEALEPWLVQIVDVACKLRGYKAPLVDEQRVLTTGRISPSDATIVSASGNTHTAISSLPSPHTETVTA